MQISLIFKIKINLFWTAVITELRFIKLSVRTETVKVTKIIKVIIMILISEEWLLEMVMILNLTDAALATAIIQN